MTDCVGRGSYSDVLLQQRHKGGLRACVCVCVCSSSYRNVRTTAAMPVTALWNRMLSVPTAFAVKAARSLTVITLFLFPCFPIALSLPRFHILNLQCLSLTLVLSLLHTRKHTVVIHCPLNNTFVFSPLHSCLDLSSSVMLISQSATKRIQYNTDKCAYENAHVP